MYFSQRKQIYLPSFYVTIALEFPPSRISIDFVHLENMLLFLCILLVYILF